MSTFTNICMVFIHTSSEINVLWYSYYRAIINLDKLSNIELLSPAQRHENIKLEDLVEDLYEGLTYIVSNMNRQQKTAVS